jgi:hypothetical protein
MSVYKNSMNKTISSLTVIVRGAVAALALVAVTNSVKAGIVGSDVINNDGTMTYSYTINNSGNTFSVAEWSLEFGFLLPDWNQLDIFSGGDVTVPNAGWFADAGTPITGKSAQDFISLGSEDDVAAGQSLTGFSFTSRILPGTVTFEEFSADGKSLFGTTVGPVSTVPEGGGPLAGIAFASLAGFGFCIRKFSNQNHPQHAIKVG